MSIPIRSLSNRLRKAADSGRAVQFPTDEILAMYEVGAARLIFDAETKELEEQCKKTQNPNSSGEDIGSQWTKRRTENSGRNTGKSSGTTPELDESDPNRRLKSICMPQK